MTKKEIVDAAFRVWGRNFYRKTSLSQLAGELKVSKPALYRHFDSKNALLFAMTERFFDDFADFVKNDFQNAKKTSDANEGISSIIRSISEFFACNVYALVFSLINLYDRNFDSKTISSCLKARGADMSVIRQVIDKKYSVEPVVIRLIFATLSFLMSHFHKTKQSFCNPPAKKDIDEIITTICNTIERGLDYSSGKTSIDFKNLEKQVDKITPNTEPEPFFKAVAEAVAEAGPWDVSMDMVAKKLGLSKSSLYGHFKNRKDMLRRLFVSEFKRIMEFARLSIGISDDAAVQLYLGIYSITVYLRSRPEILIAMGWIRTRKLDLGKPEKNIEIFRLFEDVDIEPLRNSTEEERQRFSHLVLFLLINILTLSCGIDQKAAGKAPFATKFPAQNNDIRVLYKFITSGLGGFLR